MVHLVCLVYLVYLVDLVNLKKGHILRDVRSEATWGRGAIQKLWYSLASGLFGLSCLSGHLVHLVDLFYLVNQIIPPDQEPRGSASGVRLAMSQFTSVFQKRPVGGNRVEIFHLSHTSIFNPSIFSKCFLLAVKRVAL